jgi:hypothetical protein
LLLFNPLAFGAVEPWSIFILEWSASLLFVLWALRQVKSGELLVVWNPLFPPILIFAALVALQVVTGRTAYRYETLSNALLYCAYGSALFPGGSMSPLNVAGENASDCGPGLRLCGRHVCLDPEHVVKRQTVLAEDPAFWRLDLRSLRQP